MKTSRRELSVDMVLDARIIQNETESPRYSLVLFFLPKTKVALPKTHVCF